MEGDFIARTSTTKHTGKNHCEALLLQDPVINCVNSPAGSQHFHTSQSYRHSSF